MGWQPDGWIGRTCMQYELLNERITTSDTVSLKYTVGQSEGPESACECPEGSNCLPSREAELPSGALNIEAQHGLRKGQYRRFPPTESSICLCLLVSSSPTLPEVSTLTKEIQWGLYFYKRMHYGTSFITIYNTCTSQMISTF